MEVAKKIGQNLQLIVNQWFESQKKFADYFKVSRQTASNWCNGEVLTPYYVLLFLEEKTGIPMRTLSRFDLTREQIEFDNPFDLGKNFETDPPPLTIYLNDAMASNTHKYLPASKPNEFSELKQKVDTLWETNMHRAREMETLRMEKEALKTEIDKLKAQIKELQAGK